MRYKACVLEDQKLLRKFCQAMDRHYGCKAAFGTSRDHYGSCKACPLATAEQAMFLMTTKNMTLGEAVKQTLRDPISSEEGWEIIRVYAQKKRPYPEEGGEEGQ